MNAYTGGLLEADTFPRVLASARAPEYVSYSHAMRAWDTIKAAQLWDPAEPNPKVSRFSADLHAEVALTLMGPDGDWSELRLYSATGSAVDWHGTDAFFELAGARVTMDVTANPAKLDGYRADVIIPPEAVEEAAVRQEIAQEIAQKLLEKVAEAVRREQEEAAARMPNRRLRRW